MNERSFALPDVGEGLIEAEILTWLVQPGDTVTVNQILVEIETAKAAVELPSPFAGTVSTLHAAVGDTVAVGTTIVTIDVAAPDEIDARSASTPRPADVRPAAEGDADGEPAAAMLVGYGPRGATPARRARRPTPASSHTRLPEADSASPPAPTTPAVRVAAKPPVRKLAKDLGVDLRTVIGTGPDNVISRADVHLAAEAAVRGSASSGPEGPGLFSMRNSSEHETRIPIRGVRKHTAAAMVRSAFTAPHVTEFITVDMTATMELRDMVADRREFRDARPSPLAFVARALLLALPRTPEANASWDDAAQEIVLKHFVNLGIAAATERGLVVPNIKDAQTLGLRGLTDAIADLARTARAGKTTPAAMSDGTITITNIGVFGIDAGTPILNPGEAAILAFGAVRRIPWVVERDGVEQIEPRWVTQLALSFDHRLVDGQQGSELLANVAATLTNPGLALL